MTTTPDATWIDQNDNRQAAWARQIAADPHNGGCIRTLSDQTGPEVSENPGLRPEPTGNKPPTVAAAGPDQTDTTTGTPHTGAMIALTPTTPDLYALVNDGAEPPTALHVTLYYLGEATDIPPDAWNQLDALCRELATALPPIQANIFGAAIWNPTSDTPSVVANIGDLEGPGPNGWLGTLAAVRRGIAEAVRSVVEEQAGDLTDPEATWVPPAQHSPWVAHMCTAYPQGLGDALDMLDRTLGLVGPMELGTLRITYGPESFDYPLTGARM